MTVGSKRVMAAAGASAVALVVLAGCTGSDPAPTVSATSSAPTTSASPTTSATSAVPTTSATAGGIPEAAKADTPAGAQAFVRYFFEQINVAWTTPDPKVLDGLCEETSKSCAGMVNVAEKLLVEKQRYASAPITLGAITRATTTQVEGKITQNAVEILDEGGRRVSADSRKNLGFLVSLKRSPAGWTISQLQTVK